MRAHLHSMADTNRKPLPGDAGQAADDGEFVVCQALWCALGHNHPNSKKVIGSVTP